MKNLIIASMFLSLLASGNVFSNEADCRIFIKPDLDATPSDLSLIQQRLQENNFTIVTEKAESNLLLTYIEYETNYGCISKWCRDFARVSFIASPNARQYSVAVQFSGETIKSKRYNENKEGSVEEFRQQKNKAFLSALESFPSCKKLQESIKKANIGYEQYL